MPESRYEEILPLVPSPSLRERVRVRVLPNSESDS
jgi:hypothetical protein